MTIVAGFRVRDGVLLCADTLYSGGMKVYNSKIFRVETEEAKFGQKYTWLIGDGDDMLK